MDWQRGEKMNVLFAGNRSVTLQANETDLYSLPEAKALRVNGEDRGFVETVVFSIYDLLPDTDYTVDLEGCEPVSFHTAHESVTFNVHAFGAKGDGEHDDTPSIQAAILCCPPDGRVLVPAGKYRIGPIFLKSHIRLELAAGAALKLKTDRWQFPILPGMIQTTDEMDDVNLGSWEGNPLDAFASMITGVGVEDVWVYGPGTIDGQGQLGDWWKSPKIKTGAFRPRMLFLNACKDFVMQGITVQNSPAWNLHPYFSDNLRFLNLTIHSPADSPNTDGFDPESCNDVQILGVNFHVGDDCIAIKSGKIYMGKRYKTPCEKLEIAHCLMRDGHGGMTVGSEMAGGVHHVRVHHCEMSNTDRGLRIKTRRGRGVQGRIDDIRMDHVMMDHVRVPLAVNSMYFCDPDGHSPFVQSREKYPVTEDTPSLGLIVMEDVTAKHATNAGYVLGLPEQPMEHLVMKNVSMEIDPDSKPIACIMAEGIPAVSGEGLVLENVAQADLDLIMTGQKGEAVIRRGDA